MAESVHIGERLRGVREGRGLSYRQAAAEIGIPVASVHKIEHGGDPRWSTAVRVLTWLDEGIVLPGMIAIPKPRILTGPKHQTVDEATASYLREASQRVRDGRFWGSGVSRLVADLLGDAADAVKAQACTSDGGGS